MGYGRTTLTSLGLTSESALESQISALLESETEAAADIATAQAAAEATAAADATSKANAAQTAAEATAAADATSKANTAETNAKAASEPVGTTATHAALTATHGVAQVADDADVVVNAAAIASNTTHRGSDGKDHIDVVANSAAVALRLVEPVARYKVDGGKLVYDAALGLWVNGIQDEFAGVSIDGDWTIIGGGGGSTVTQNDKLILHVPNGGDTSGLAQAVAPGQSCRFWAYLNMAAVNDTIVYLRIRSSAGGNYMAVGLFNDGGIWKFVTQKLGVLNAQTDAAIDRTLWIGGICNSQDHTMEGWYSANAEGSFPGVPGVGDWDNHGTKIDVTPAGNAAAYLDAAPVIEILGAETGGNNLDADVHHFGLIYE